MCHQCDCDCEGGKKECEESKIMWVLILLRWFYVDYLIIEYLFLTWLPSFKSTFQAFYSYIYHVCEANIHWDSGCFIYVKKVDRDQDGRKHTLFVFVILQKHIVLL